MIVVNITTTSERLDLCAATVFSILNQKLLPDQISIWVSKEPYMSDKGISSEPDWINFFNKKNDIIKLKYTENTGPYRKIIPALRSYSASDTLIYCDDDVIYGREWLVKLMSMYTKYNGQFAVASRVRLKTKNLFGKYKSYTLFPLCTSESTLFHDFIITGVGGCIVNRNFFKDEFIFNDDFIDVAPKTDDLWISTILQISGAGIKVCPLALTELNEIEHSIGALNKINNVDFNYSSLKRIRKKITIKIAAYLGYPISNNDKSQLSISSYFFSK